MVVLVGFMVGFSCMGMLLRGSRVLGDLVKMKLLLMLLLCPAGSYPSEQMHPRTVQRGLLEWCLRWLGRPLVVHCILVLIMVG